MGYLDKAGLSRAFTKLKTLIDAKADKNHTHSYAGSSSAGGSATSAVKLATARTIGAGTAVTSTAQSFNGESSITIPINSVKESYLDWGGKGISGSVSPVGMALSSEHNANRLAFINGDALTMEYSSDGGSTWKDYGYSASNKSTFCTTYMTVPIGRANTSSNYTTSSRTRITIDGQSCVYTNPKKLLINISSSGQMKVLVEYKTGASGASWQTFGTYNLVGWGGWNDIPLVLSTFGCFSGVTTTNRYLRMTFIMASVDSNYPTTAQVSGIRLFGSDNWLSASENNNKGVMSSTGHLYSYDINANATFPAQVTATQFNGTATRATKLSATQKGSATQPVYINSDGVPTATTYTLGKSVPSTAVFTDTNTWQANTVSQNGYVTAPGATNANKVWKTDANGVPGWRTDANDNTWRGIQNNLTSTSTSDSLSAYQGKVLNEKFGSYVPATRTVNNKALSANITLSASDVGAASSSHTHNYAGSSSAGGNATWANGATYANYSYNEKPTKTAGSGSAYTATVSGLTLVTGASFVVVPHTVSTTTAPTLNVNSLGAKTIRMRLSSSPGSTTALATSSFLTASKPVRMVYDGTYWVIDDFIRPDASDLYGSVAGSGTSAPGTTTSKSIYALKDSSGNLTAVYINI